MHDQLFSTGMTRAAPDLKSGCLETGSQLVGVMCGLGPVGDDDRIDIPQLGQRSDMLFVLPVAEAGQVAVGAGLAVVLGSGLTVHLQDAGPGPTQHPA
ncbi:MAG TPA: hypothetical protein VJ820_03600 [Propionibacteriaceae bacterium]|nr:hypothetical protein [Propionibacteriaceae bacterium]